MEANNDLKPWYPEYDNTLSDRCKDLIKNFPFRQIVGSLLYLSIWTRTDICFAVHRVAKFSMHPTLESVHACKRILSYIQCTKQLGLSFHPGSKVLTTFVDSSFADVPENRKSTGGQIQFLGYFPIYWET